MGHWNRVARVRSRTQSMLQGWTEQQASMPGTFWVGGEALTAAGIITRLGASGQAHALVERCRTLLADAIVRRDNQLDAEQKLHEDLTALLRQTVGSDGQRLGKFGVVPPQARRKLTSEELVIAHARSLATRQKRGTKGKRQREAITTEPQPTVTVLGIGGRPPAHAPTAAHAEPSAAPAVAAPPHHD